MKSSNAISMWKLNVGWNDIGSWDNSLKVINLKIIKIKFSI